MSVKPIQDDLPVSEVGENPKVNKTDIDSHEGKLSEIENKYKIDAIWRKF